MSDVITVVGNVAADPEERSTPSGASVARFRIASTVRRRDRETGEWSDAYTNFYTVTAWDALGANAAASLRKGERAIVVGRLKLRTWEKEGRQGQEAEITADAVGHDLRWGTSGFRRAAREPSAEAQPTAATGEGDNPAAPAEAAWATPGELLDAETPF